MENKLSTTPLWVDSLYTLPPSSDTKLTEHALKDINNWIGLYMHGQCSPMIKLHISNMQESLWGPLKMSTHEWGGGAWNGLLANNRQQKNQPHKIILALDLISF